MHQPLIDTKELRLATKDERINICGSSTGQDGPMMARLRTRTYRTVTFTPRAAVSGDEGERERRMKARIVSRIYWVASSRLVLCASVTRVDFFFFFPPNLIRAWLGRPTRSEGR